MKRPPKITVYWDNPPTKKSGLTIQRDFTGHIYERKVSSDGWVSSTEAAAALGISLRHLYNLVSDGKLKPKGNGDRHAFKLSDIKRYRFHNTKLRRGGEAWLVG